MTNEIFISFRTEHYPYADGNNTCMNMQVAGGEFSTSFDCSDWDEDIREAYKVAASKGYTGSMEEFEAAAEAAEEKIVEYTNEDFR